MGHELSPEEELDYHHEKYGWYCRYCQGGEFDSLEARDKHEAKCKMNPNNIMLISAILPDITKCFQDLGQAMLETGKDISEFYDVFVKEDK